MLGKNVACDAPRSLTQDIALQELKQRFQLKTERIRAQYQPLYSVQSKPPTEDAVIRRKQELAALITACTTFFHDLKPIKKRSKITKEDFIELRQPLWDIYSEIQRENKLLLDWAREKKAAECEYSI